MLGPHHGQIALLMDSAYQDNATRELAQEMGLMAVVPPNPQRRQPWTYDKQRYAKRNRIERLFRRLKAWRRVFTRYDSSIACSPPSLPLPSSPKHCGSVNRP